MTPIKHRITHSLARTHEALQLELEQLGWVRIRLHHGLERRRKQKAMRHLVALQQLECHLWRKPAGERHNRAPHTQTRKQSIHEPACPSPISGAPKHGAVTRL